MYAKTENNLTTDFSISCRRNIFVRNMLCSLFLFALLFSLFLLLKLVHSLMTLSKADEDELEATAIKSSNIGSGASISQVDCGGNGSVIIVIVIGSGRYHGDAERDRGETSDDGHGRSYCFGCGRIRGHGRGGYLGCSRGGNRDRRRGRGCSPSRAFTSPGK